MKALFHDVTGYSTRTDVGQDKGGMVMVVNLLEAARRTRVRTDMNVCATITILEVHRY